MNDALKAAGRIGAELGAAKAEVEKLRGLLHEVIACQAAHYGDGTGLHLAMITLADRLKGALSQQADPAETTDTYTAVDMATAAAQGFRDGQAAVEQAPVQDEREAVERFSPTTSVPHSGRASEVEAYMTEDDGGEYMTVTQHERIVARLSRPAHTAPQPDPSSALADVIAERRRQIAVEGWTPEHDDEHGRGEMALAAACYARHAIRPPQLSDVPATWPWGASWWKPGEPRRMLVKAAALILAEIERLDRAAARGGAGDE